MNFLRFFSVSYKENLGKLSSGDMPSKACCQVLWCIFLTSDITLNILQLAAERMNCHSIPSQIDDETKKSHSLLVMDVIRLLLTRLWFLTSSHCCWDHCKSEHMVEHRKDFLRNLYYICLYYLQSSRLISRSFFLALFFILFFSSLKQFMLLFTPFLYVLEGTRGKEE